MDRRRQQKIFVYIILACVAIVVLVIAIAGGGGGTQVPGIPTGSVSQQRTLPEVVGVLTPQQEAAWNRLVQESATPPSIIVEHGVVRFLTAEVLIADTIANGANAKADAFIKNYSDLFQLDPSVQQLTLFESKISTAGEYIFRYRQQFNGIPVLGSDVIISVSQSGYITSINSGYIPNLSASSSPKISEADAVGLIKIDQGAEVNPIEASSLTIYNAVVYGQPPSAKSHLAWLVTIENQTDGGIWSYIVDAEDGQILDRIYELQEARDREVWDAHNRTAQISQLPFMSTLVLNEQGAVKGQTPDDTAWTVWRHAGTVYDYFNNTHHRDNYDGESDTTYKNYVHINASCPNAFWNETYQAMFYCDGVVGIDVVAHEYTHGITSSEADLVYKNESGALNESYSDVFAAMIDTVHPWIITFDDAGTEIKRNIANPLTGYPRRYQDWVNPGEGLCTKVTEKSTGCVHINSSITSLAAYFLSQSGDQDGVHVSGIGSQKVALIYYDTLVNRLGQNSTFIQARQATLASCRSMIGGSSGITANDCNQVENAFAAVGIGTASLLPTSTPTNATTTLAVTDTPAGVTSTPPPIYSADTATALVFDSSGSMDNRDVSGLTKIEAAKQAGQRILDILEAESQATSGTVSQVGLVHFSTYTEVSLELTNDIAAARSALDGLYPQDMTGMANGLKAGITMLENRTGSSKPIIILLSDGLANVPLEGTSAYDYDEIKQQILDLATQAGGEGMCIYTVGFGEPSTITFLDSGSLDEEFLRDIAEASGCGEYYNAQNATELANVYVQLRHTSTGNVLLSQTGTIAQDEQQTVASVSVPENQLQMMYTLNWPGSELSALLIDPSGQQVGSGYPGAAFYQASSLASVIIQNPLAGAWSVQALGVDVPEGTTSFNAVLSVRPNPATPTPEPIPTQAPTAVPVVPASPGFPIALILLVIGGGAVAIYVLYTVTRRNRQAGALSAGAGTAVGGARLVITSGANQGQSVPLYDGLTIGRTRNSGLFLADTSVSRQHAVLRYSQGSWYIQDQASKGGTFVNGQRLPAARLKAGDQIRVGSTTMVFQG